MALALFPILMLKFVISFIHVYMYKYIVISY